MSIDYYPSLDAHCEGVAIREDLGSASLFYRNELSLFPEFENRDLRSLFAEIKYSNFCIDGGTCEDLSDPGEIKNLAQASEGRALITLTIGGNDLLQIHRSNPAASKEELSKKCSTLKTRYDGILSLIREHFPGCLLILTTVFDPTDGTGIMPGVTPLSEDRLPIEFLNDFNDHIRSLNAEELIVADVHKHFLGHGGMSESIQDFWYLPSSPIEPGYRGASEIRRMWLGALESYIDPA